MRSIAPVSLLVLSIAASPALANVADTETLGVLDRPLPDSPTDVSLDVEQPPAVIAAGSPEEVQEILREELEEEQTVLEQLPIDELEELAEQGERAAQVTLAESFAEEAALLSFAPAAANDALSDAVRWYSLAARRGFPGAPSLDQTGVKFYPIRAQRAPAGS